MLAIIIGTHGKFAEELLKTCEMICGTVNNAKAVTLMPGEGSEDIISKYEKALADLDCSDGVIFLNDLFGGSPYNAACRAAVKDAAYGIVTGVNLPMLIEMVGLQLVGEKLDIQEVMTKAEAAGGSGIQKFHVSTIQDEEDDL